MHAFKGFGVWAVCNIWRGDACENIARLQANLAGLAHHELGNIVQSLQQLHYIIYSCQADVSGPEAAATTRGGHHHTMIVWHHHETSVEQMCTLLNRLATHSSHTWVDSHR
jgi:hypothetical protein